MRFFNTAGPVNCQDHYCLPPLERIDLDEVMRLIAQRKYFVLHAPRQTGKTSTLLALAEHLNRSGDYRAVYANIESAQAARGNVERGITGVIEAIALGGTTQSGDDPLKELANRALSEYAPISALGAFLSTWASRSPTPAVLLIDEIDTLVGDTMISVLRQLRAGYTKRPAFFPSTIILCGVRDVRDYCLHESDGRSPITGGSAFNIKAVSLRMGDFRQEEVERLLVQHTQETGQVFEPAALALVWELTQGQPWLVNALAYEACFQMKEGRDRSRPIAVASIAQAKENLIQRRETHLDQLADKLREPRVRRVIEPMLAGTALGDVPWDDRDYLVDLGLLRRDPLGGLVIANPIYREVVPRMLASGPEDSLPRLQPTWLTPQGDLDVDRLLQAFLAFWRQHGQPLLGSAPYHEIAPHLVMMAFLHRVVNAGGTLEREYAIGSGRMELCLRYRAIVLGIEIKVWREGDPLAEGLAQLDGYLDGLGQPTGWLVIFDRRAGQPPISQRTSAEPAVTPAGRRVTVIRR